ncbi:methylated-DNA--[protein]-cysteine S-methyltransferase [Helicobacter suis]|uniref:methylated-DNA--[protein]-cysteine S-methyltransferase n=1 Tax=Helicobacter suis TaxID=104628 RepID=UPI002493A884|nr:methylated-DNA--[protein]-cysteine S-methyltransferase [Helicobacter suis]
MSVYFFKTPLSFPMPYLRLCTNTGGLYNLEFTKSCLKSDKPDSRMHAVIEALEGYFEGSLRRFNISLVLQGTSFEKQVWQALKQIPYGQTMSYQEIAKILGKPKACRAVGQANHKNPCPLFIPCHRAVRQNGDLGGYGGGVDIKAWLLAHEKKNCGL